MITRNQVTEIATKIENEIVEPIEKNLTIWVNAWGSVSIDRHDSNSHQASTSYGEFATYDEAYEEMNSDGFVEWYEKNYR
jgi:hypothetical protein